MFSADDKNNRKPFITCIFHGKRFADHTSIPVDILPEFSAYRQIVLEVAKRLYLERHQSRQRIPKGFDEKFDLRLTEAKPGSTALTIERNVLTPSLFDDARDIFDDARDLVDKCIANASRKLPHHAASFPRQVLNLFRNFGRSLQEEDFISFRLPGRETDNRETETRYTRSIREHLVSESLSREEKFITIEGIVTAIDVRSLKFTLEKSPGVQREDEVLQSDKISCTYQQDLHEDIILNALEQRKFVWLRIEGVGRLAPNGYVDEIREIHQIGLFKPSPGGPDIDARLDELGQLKDGWLDGDGVAYKSDDLKSVSYFLHSLCWEWDIPTPHIYATPENFIQAEWTFGEWETSLTFDFGSKTLTGLAVNVKTFADDEFVESFEQRNLSAAAFKAGDFLDRFYQTEAQ